MTSPTPNGDIPASVAPARSRNGRLARTLLTWSLVVGAFVFLARVLAPQIAIVQQSMADIRWLQIALAALVALPMFVLKGWYHLNLLDRMGGERGSRRIGLPIYLQAQIVRYLPGKIWGVVYQSQRMSGTHSAGEVVIANLWQMITTNTLAAGLVVSVLMAFRYSYLYLLLLIPLIACVEWLHRHPAVESWALRLLGRFLPRFVPLATSKPLPPMPWKGTAMLCSEWIFYFLGFFVMLHGKAPWSEIVLEGTWYGGASILALAAFIVPAGIAVREAIFVAAPGLIDTDAATLAVTATLARIVFLGAEIGAALLSSILTIRARHV